MDTDALRWSRIKEEESLRTSVFRIVTRTMRSPDLSLEGDFYILDVADWVNVVALTVANELILVHQYRFGTQEMSLEVPGGMVDPGEEHAAAARRELLEETGFASTEWEHLGTMSPNPALNTNRCGVYLARNCTYVGAGGHDPQEFIGVELMGVRRALDAVLGGSIHHALTVASLSYAALRHPEFSGLS